MLSLPSTRRGLSFLSKSPRLTLMALLLYLQDWLNRPFSLHTLPTIRWVLPKCSSQQKPPWFQSQPWPTQSSWKVQFLSLWFKACLRGAPVYIKAPDRGFQAVSPKDYTCGEVFIPSAWAVRPGQGLGRPKLGEERCFAGPDSSQPGAAGSVYPSVQHKSFSGRRSRQIGLTNYCRKTNFCVSVLASWPSLHSTVSKS